MVLIGEERCGRTRRNQNDCMQKFEEPASPCGRLRSAPREGGWHHVSHARPGFWQHDESQSEATPSAIDVTSGWQKKPAQPGGSRNKAVALDLCRDQHERFRCGQPAAGHYQCNKDTSPDDIVFNIPASTAPLLDVPVPGFDPGTQTWTITLQSPLPAITNTVSIDGYSEAPVGVPYRYPNAVSSAEQSVALTGSPTGGTFTLTTGAPFAVNTVTLPYNATAATVQAALGPYVGGINNIS